VRVVARVLEKLIQEVANQRRFDARSAGTLQPAGMDPLIESSKHKIMRTWILLMIDALLIY
jgi:hypothetical protein